MLIKVCGMAHADNLRQVARLQPDLLGFIFYRPSPRNAFGLSPQVVGSLAGHIKKTGVFVDESGDAILRTVGDYALDYVQLHGDETPEFCRALRTRVAGVIKAFAVGEPEDLEKVSQYEGICDFFIFDTKTPAKGGSGKKFDHGILDAYNGETPFLLSGGIGPGDTALLSARHPRCAGLDLNSRFEISPGIKDTALLEKFITEIKKTE